VFVISNTYEMIFSHVEAWTAEPPNMDEMRQAVELWSRSVDTWTSYPWLSTQFASGSELKGAPDVVLHKALTYELGDETRVDEQPLVEDEFAGATPYASHFARQPHHNLLAPDTGLGPVVISLEKPDLANERPVRALLWTTHSILRILIPAESTYSLGSMLRFLFLKKFPPPPSGHSYHPMPDLLLLRAAKFTLLDSKQLIKQLVDLEQALQQNHFKFGVLNVKPGQETEDEWFSNGHAKDPPSPAYLEFLNTLGRQVPLSHQGYVGLVDEGDGVYVDTTPEGYEICYHVPHLLPFVDTDPQRLARKRHVGNDVVIVVFNESDGTPLDPTAFHSSFTHVFIVVTPLGLTPLTDKERKLNPKHAGWIPQQQQYRVSVACKGHTGVFGPYIAANIIDAASLEAWITCKAINGERSARREPIFARIRERTLLSSLNVRPPL
jgi:hypothetical protein